VVCDEVSRGGDGEYCDDNDAQLDCSNVLYHKALSGKHVPRAVLFDLEPDVIGAARASRLGEVSHPGDLVNQNAGAGSNWTKAHCNMAGKKF
jgi:hypothetical protein